MCQVHVLSAVLDHLGCCSKAPVVEVDLRIVKSGTPCPETVSAGTIRPEQLADKHGVSNLGDVEVSIQQTIDDRDVEVHGVMSVHPVEGPEVVRQFGHVLGGERPSLLGADHTGTGNVNDRGVEVVCFYVYDDVSHFSEDNFP